MLHNKDSEVCQVSLTSEELSSYVVSILTARNNAGLCPIPPLSLLTPTQPLLTQPGLTASNGDCGFGEAPHLDTKGPYTDELHNTS